jgi:Protein of unknown function (DUF3300)
MSSPTNSPASQIVERYRLHLYAFKLSNLRTDSLSPVLRRVLALVMALLLLPVSSPELLAQQPPVLQLGQPQQNYSGKIQSDEPEYQGQPYQGVNGYPQQGDGQLVQPLSAERLQQLVAPIALYPDALVALVLTASTYPAQVQDANSWRQAQGNAPAEQIAAGANAQNWDPSIKALTAFPQVLAQMDQNLPWATDLGNAYYNQPSDVLEAVQVMRARAQSAGNLQPTLQEAVNYVGGNIQLAPVDPQTIYVPEYNPWTVYGPPVAPYPGFSLIGALGSFLGSTVGSAVIHWRPGIAMTAFAGMPWGLLAWGLSWLLQAVLFHNSNYYSNSPTVADWGFPYGGSRAASSGFYGGSNSYPQVARGYNGAFGDGTVHRPPSSYDYSRRGYTTGPRNVFVHRPPNGAPESFVHRPPNGVQESFVHQPLNSAEGFVPRPPNTYARPGGGYTTAPGHGFSPRKPNSYSGYDSMERASRGAQAFAYSRTPQQNGRWSTVHRPSTDNRALTARAQYSSLGHSGMGYTGSYEKQARSSGFHPFGGGSRSESFHGGSSAPKMKAPKSYGGGYRGGGGHSGGGHWSGGGHSGGGHSSGTHHA